MDVLLIDGNSYLSFKTIKEQEKHFSGMPTHINSGNCRFLYSSRAVIIKRKL